MSTLDLTTANREQIEAAGAAAFMGALKQLSDKEVEQLFPGPNRSMVLDLIFETMPTLFRADRAGTTDAVVHWVITGGPTASSDTYSMKIAGGECSVDKGAEGNPTVTLSMSAPDFIKVMTRSGNPVMMFMMGKIKATGDVGLAANVGGFFSMPKD